MSRHVSAEQLARFRDGDLGRAATRRVSAHLAACAACQAEAEALAGLPALLAATQVPPIPDHLAARIETALATEAAHRAATSPALDPARLDSTANPAQPAPAAHSARPAAAGHRRASRRSSLPRWVVANEQGQRYARRSGPARRILAAAAVVAVLGGGYALVSNLSTSGSNTSASSPSGSRAAASPAHAPAARPASSAFASAVPSAPAGIAPGVAGRPELGPVLQYGMNGHAGRFTPVRSSTAYVAAQLSQQATAALAEVRNSIANAGGTAGHTSASAGGESGRGAFSAATLTRLRGCVARVAGGQTVLLVDLASFEGSPATIIVTAPPGSARASQVWAVGPACSSSAADVLAHQQLP
jgi:Putative zinc-finger